MKTAVVILNWNGEKFLQKFLPGLLHSVQGKDAEVIVADNASTDGSMRLMLYDFPKVKTIRFSKNYGFTGGYNRALFQTDAQYYVLINSDIEVHDGWLDPLVEWMDTHPECGICAPKLHSYRDRDMFEYAGALFRRIPRGSSISISGTTSSCWKTTWERLMRSGYITAQEPFQAICGQKAETEKTSARLKRQKRGPGKQEGQFSGGCCWTDALRPCTS